VLEDAPITVAELQTSPFRYLSHAETTYSANFPWETILLSDSECPHLETILLSECPHLTEQNVSYVCCCIPRRHITTIYPVFPDVRHTPRLQTAKASIQLKRTYVWLNAELARDEALWSQPLDGQLTCSLLHAVYSFRGDLPSHQAAYKMLRQPIVVRQNLASQG